MDIRIDVNPVDDTTPAEVAAITHLLKDALDRSREIDSVATVQAVAPDHAKGFFEEIGSLLLGLPVGAITGVLDIIRTVAARQAQPVILKLTAGGVEVSFDPKTLSPEKLAALVAQLRPAGRPLAPA